jgi:toxin ParE1/3/4
VGGRLGPHGSFEIPIRYPLQVLKEFPQIGQRYSPSTRAVRLLLYGHYRIAYLVKPNGNVDILGVFHGALDLTKYQL